MCGDGVSCYCCSALIHGIYSLDIPRVTADVLFISRSIGSGILMLCARVRERIRAFYFARARIYKFCTCTLARVSLRIHRYLPVRFHTSPFLTAFTRIQAGDSNLATMYYAPGTKDSSLHGITGSSSNKTAANPSCTTQTQEVAHACEMCTVTHTSKGDSTV